METKITFCTYYIGMTTPPTTIWTVHRQDDNGKHFVVETGLTREEAERLVATLEQRGHKQAYWAEPDSTS